MHSVSRDGRLEMFSCEAPPFNAPPLLLSFSRIGRDWQCRGIWFGEIESTYSCGKIAFVEGVLLLLE